MLVMGSSMRVHPAASMPEMVQGIYVMINLQKTPSDKNATMVIHERVDKVVEMLM